MSSTTQPIFSIDRDEIVGSNDIILHAFVSKEAALRYSKDVENNPIVILGKAYRLIGEYQLMTLDKKLYRIQIRKHKKVWVMLAHISDNKYYLLKIIRQKVNKISHPCFTGCCEHVKDLVI